MSIVKLTPFLNLFSALKKKYKNKKIPGGTPAGTKCTNNACILVQKKKNENIALKADSFN